MSDGLRPRLPGDDRSGSARYRRGKVTDFLLFNDMEVVVIPAGGQTRPVQGIARRRQDDGHPCANSRSAACIVYQANRPWVSDLDTGDMRKVLKFDVAIEGCQ